MLMENPDEEIAKRAINSKLQSVPLRAQREFIGNLKLSQKKLLNLNILMPTVLNMEVYDIQHSTDPALSVLLWQNGQALQRLDLDAKNIIGAGTGTWNFYYDIFGRNSIDDLGMLLKHFIHYGNTEDDMNNAMWDGQQMLYGDGDGKIFGSFTSDIDIIGHELTHGVTQYESNLDYENQSGALNESLSDVFGIMIKQRMLNQDVNQSNWLIGENVIIGNDYALRSMKAPGTAYVDHPYIGTDPQPATMDHFINLPNTPQGDWGGVHYNSSIPNFAFYVTAINIGGYAWEKAGKIWYDAMVDKNLKRNATFKDFKNLTLVKAKALYGINSNEYKATEQGWKEAKI